MQSQIYLIWEEYALVFLLRLELRNPCHRPRSRNNEQRMERWTMFDVHMRQTMEAAGLGLQWAPPSALQPFACSAPSPRPSGIQACPLFILPLAPRAHSFKYSDRWMDTAMRIVSSLLQNVPENHIFPSFPSGILNTQNQVNFSTDSEVNKSSTMQEFYSIPNGKGIFFKL